MVLADQLLAAEPSSGSPWVTVLMFAGLFALMYFMFIRPNAKRRKEAQQMQSQLGPGDEIVTIGGLYGTVVSSDDETITLQISSDGTTAKFARQAVGRVLKQTSVPEEASAAEPTSPVQETK